MEQHLLSLAAAMRVAAGDERFQNTLAFLNRKRAGKRRSRAEKKDNA
jgi:hypothetical protein